MYSDFAPRLADVLTSYCQPVEPGNYVVIVGSAAALPAMIAIYAAALRRGGNPEIIVDVQATKELLLREGTEDQLAFLPPTALTYIEQADVMYGLFSDTNTRLSSGISPERMRQRQNARAPYYEIYFRRDAEKSLRWTATAWPTNAFAQEADMGLLAYTRFVYHACGLDQPDPVAYWQAFHDRQQRLVDWLHGKDHVEVTGPGIDLRFSMAGRTWINADGHTNFPDGEIFTGPVEDSVNGTVAFSYPTIFQGQRVEGVHLTFKDGVVTDARADTGEDFLLGTLDVDEGARRLGEFAIGTNDAIQQFTGNTLFDEKIGGTIHMALGNSYEKTGAANKSAIHWDIVHGMRDGGTIHVDGELFYQNGKFMI